MPASDPLKNLYYAQQFKDAGNNKFKSKEYTAAMGQYHRAIIFIKSIYASQTSPFNDMLGGVHQASSVQPVSTKLQQDIDQLYADCQANLAACLLQSESASFSRVVECCDEAIKRVSNHSKAHYRRGVALYNLHKYDDAIASLETAAKLQKKPDANISRYLSLSRQGVVEQESQLRSQCKAMFAA